MIGTLLVIVLTLGTLAFVGYPLFLGFREHGEHVLPDLETQAAYEDTETMELDFRTGKLAADEYERLRQSAANEGTDEIEQRIKALRAQRKQKPAATATRNRCPQCGAPFDPGDRFCVRCGASLTQERACRNCGAPYTAGDRFCAKCGKPL
jgi:uncharacterized protein with PIN domain